MAFSEITTVQAFVPQAANVPNYFKVYDILGNLVLENKLENGENTITIDGSKLKPGIYTYSITNAQQGLVVKRMVKIN